MIQFPKAFCNFAAKEKILKFTYHVYKLSRVSEEGIGSD